jgi:hypothetical protein
MSDRRATRPLNTDAVKAANAAVAAETGGRPLTLGPADAALRKKWMDAYIAAGGKSETIEPGGKKPGEVVASCERPSQDPNITTVPDGGPTDLGCGGSDWSVWFDLPQPAGEDGWVIQEVTYTYDVKNPDGSTNTRKSYHFWEAWEVKKGKKVTIWQDQGLDDNDDRYTDPVRPGTKGEAITVGKAKFFEGPLPPDFKQNNPDTLAGILHSTTQKPDFWDGTGTDHNTTITWDCTGDPETSHMSAKAGSQSLTGTK